MPEWLGPALNSSALATIVAFVFWCIIKLGKFLGPQVKAVTEGHVTVMKDLGTNSIKQTALMERVVGMSDAHSTTLNVHGQILNVHSEQLRNIAEAVDARIVKNLSQSPAGMATVNLQQAVEVSPDGSTRQVVVATEVIHQPESKP